MKQCVASGTAQGASVVLEVVASLNGSRKSPWGLTGESSDAALFPRREFRRRHGGEVDVQARPAPQTKRLAELTLMTPKDSSLEEPKEEGRGDES
eukprot:3379007-Pyramimonas_sp.AAC.1